MNVRTLGSLTLIVFTLVNPVSTTAQDAWLRFTMQSTKPFDDVVEEVRSAISEHNFRITGEARIGEAIAERERISFPRASVIHFCNLSYAQKLLELNPKYILYMPCRISIMESKQRIVVEALLLPQHNARRAQTVREVNGILVSIVKYAVQ